jgi:hypothetical protein
MDPIASVIVPGGQMALRYAEMLLGGITPETFARKPEGIDTNSPAFCFGHLTIYPELILEAIGRKDLAIDFADYQELFGAGKECVDDPDGTIYPAMESILARFRERHAVAMEAIASTSDSEMLKENPRERTRPFLPTVGAALGFYLAGHMFTHLGQVSAWRRCMGLKSVM